MKNAEIGLRVRLKVDLTRYNEKLVPGIEGITIGRNGIWSRSQDRFITVKFQGDIVKDVLWSSLEIIDEDYIKQTELQERKFQEELKTTKEAVLKLGPKGGFKDLMIDYESNGAEIHSAIGFKEEADKIMEILKKYGIEIKIEKDKKNSE
ncbi:hypothetical protein [Ferroplasma sp.]|uniref:hypothetical protein n=1 Tax=Ferroplasma sp. TaxID=2591003 RepID=UPI00260CF9E7|nr:hypothetical protein [Ferroplasma sp.]